MLSFAKNIARAALGFLLVSFCIGCESAAARAQRMEPLLSQAGFTVVPAKSPTQIEKLNDLKPLKVSYFTREGKPVYWFADPYVCHCLFRGTEQNYQMYRSLSQEQELAEALDNYQLQQSYDTYMAGAADQVFYGQ